MGKGKFREDYHYMNILGGIEADVEELYCISACRHRILIKQSSYGWWAAKLSLHKDGMNIITKRDVLKGIDNRVELTEEEVERLLRHYTVALPAKKNMDEFLQSMEKGIMEGRNQDVILLNPKEDFVYQYGIEHYHLGILEAEGKLYSAVPCVVEHLRDESEDIVVIGHKPEEIGFASDVRK